MEEGQKIYRYGVIYHDFLLNFLKYIGVFSGGLLQHFVGIAISTCFGEDC